MGTHDLALTYEAKDAETQSITTTVYSHKKNVHGLVIIVCGLVFVTRWPRAAACIGHVGETSATLCLRALHPTWDLLSCPLVWGIGSPGGLVPRQVSAFRHFL